MKKGIALILTLALALGGCASTPGDGALEGSTEAGMSSVEEADTSQISRDTESAAEEEAETEVDISALNRTDHREDYPELTDAEFANFREVTAGYIAPGRLYRSSSPIDPGIGRNTYADEAMEAAGITGVINLSNSEEKAKSFEGYENTYYAAQDIIFLDLTDSSYIKDLEPGIAEGFRYIAEHEGPFLVHCRVGKDRTGTFIMVLEALMGASVPDITGDYLKTFENFYDVVDGVQQPLTPEETEAVEHKMRENLRRTFELETFPEEGFEKCAEDYLLSIGLTDEEISNIRKHLGE